jgi:hypothetical protein
VRGHNQSFSLLPLYLDEVGVSLSYGHPLFPGRTLIIQLALNRLWPCFQAPLVLSMSVSDTDIFMIAFIEYDILRLLVLVHYLSFFPFHRVLAIILYKNNLLQKGNAFLGQSVFLQATFGLIRNGHFDKSGKQRRHKI